MGTPTHRTFNIDRAGITDTPTKSKHAVTSPAILGDLAEGRQALLKDLGEAIPQVPLQWFKDHILPSLPNDLDIEALVTTLEGSGAIVDGCWSQFQVAPADRAGHEDAVFRPFATIARRIGQAAAVALPNLEQTVVFKCNPHMKPQSSLRKNTSKPDGYGLYTDHYAYREDGRVHWEFIVAPGEKKKFSNVDTINDNVEKITWSLNHIMREDVRRRFVIGYTIENTNMRLWFCSRSDILVTEAFDFRKDHASLVHFFVSLMYATSAQLGYDPTIKPVPDPKGRARNQYDITLQAVGGKDRVFRTKSIISSIGAESIRGRGTRVWEAQEILNETPLVFGESVALKDSWIDDDREREAIILQKILKCAAELEDKNVLAILEKHLLNVVCYSDVYVHGKKDQTHTLLRRGGTIPTDLPPFVLVLPPSSKTPDVSRDAEGLPAGGDFEAPEKKQTPQIIEYGVKAHHRIAFKQVGTTIDTVNSVSTILELLMQILDTLQAVHACGWIHRDISTGNVLVVGGVAKLADFEYAKKMDDNTQHTLRTGTAYYMAVEVDSQEYHFFRHNKTEAGEDEAEIEAIILSRNLEREAPVTPKNEVSQSIRLPPFRHNPLHDSEGVWWLTLRLLLDRDVDLGGRESRQDVTLNANRRVFYHKLFQQAAARMKALSADGSFARGEMYVHHSMLPVARTLETIRMKLKDAYEVAEADIAKIDHTAAWKFCRVFLANIIRLKRTYSEHDVELKPFRPPPATKTTPEAPGATAPGLSLDSRQAPPKRRREDEYTYVGIGHISPHVEAEDAGSSDALRAAKRRRQADNNGEVADSSVDEAEEAEVEALLGLFIGLSTAVDKGKAKDAGPSAAQAGGEKGKARVMRKSSRLGSSAGAGTSMESATGSRRSQRLALIGRKTTA